jgi:hypothetical protein
MCNAILICIGLALIGVEHEILLGFAVFILCLVPTLGATISLVLVVVFALFQYGGGLGLALKAGGIVLLVMLIENFVLGPRILGKMMELHPVLLLILLPLAFYFIGIWGLILATPVAVYVVHVLVLQRDLPGSLGVLLLQLFEPGADRLQISRRQKPHLVEHLGVGDRGADVIGHEAGVEPVILARGVAQDAVVQRLALVPQAAQAASSSRISAYARTKRV